MTEAAATAAAAILGAGELATEVRASGHGAQHLLLVFEPDERRALSLWADITPDHVRGVLVLHLPIDAVGRLKVHNQTFGLRLRHSKRRDLVPPFIRLMKVGDGWVRVLGSHLMVEYLRS